MKHPITRYVLSTLILSSLCLPALAQRELPPKPLREIKEKINRLPPEERKKAAEFFKIKIKNLHDRLKQAKKARQKEIIASEIQKIEDELDALVLRQPPIQGEVNATSPTPAPPPPLEVQRPRPIPEIGRFRPEGPQINLSAGYMAGIAGAIFDLRYFEPFDLPAVSLRIGAAYAQGEDNNKIVRKHALILLGAIYRLNPPRAPGVRSYIGAGVNYDVYTTGKVSGSYGGDVFYGVEGNLSSGGVAYLEIGYSIIRTGIVPKNAGLTALLGYRI